MHYVMHYVSKVTAPPRPSSRWSSQSTPSAATVCHRRLEPQASTQGPGQVRSATHTSEPHLARRVLLARPRHLLCNALCSAPCNVPWNAPCDADALSSLGIVISYVTHHVMHYGMHILHHAMQTRSSRWVSSTPCTRRRSTCSCSCGRPRSSGAPRAPACRSAPVGPRRRAFGAVGEQVCVPPGMSRLFFHVSVCLSVCQMGHGLVFSIFMLCKMVGSKAFHLMSHSLSPSACLQVRNSPTPPPLPFQPTPCVSPLPPLPPLPPLRLHPVTSACLRLARGRWSSAARPSARSCIM